MNTKNILIAGVGGQGTILAGKLLTSGLFELGFDVKMCEIRGMSQRGGSVLSHIRYGKDVSSPVIEMGSADIMIAFEKLEALRNLSYLRPDATAIVNDLEIAPMGVLSQTEEYPANILERIQHTVPTVVINASKIAAEELCNAKVVNVILLGVLVQRMGLTDANWEKIIKDNVKARFVEINLRAFDIGLNYNQNSVLGR